MMLMQLSHSNSYTSASVSLVDSRFAIEEAVPLPLPASLSDRSQHRVAFLQSVLEGLVDGILILSVRGEVLHANTRARRICRQYVQAESSTRQVPEPIWQVCRVLIDSREAFPEQKTLPETELVMDEKTTLRVRAQWIDLPQIQQACLLVTLENRSQSIQNLAIADAHKYGLTPRETEVWALRRAGYSYKEISSKLYITHNTVKRHVKNILAKVQDDLM